MMVERKCEKCGKIENDDVTIERITVMAAGYPIGEHDLCHECIDIPEKFGDVTFDVLAEWIAEGIYDGRRFKLKANNDGATVDGDFTDEERLFIATQWEMQTA
ncbi:hypothetical protein [Paenibacillus cymbidii]|uniref:hypothetical protein n=1 Tax=Paenibacillus cymbidii TaxID=1639034 RepID=UPI001081BA25|nr:hypothetical protein [Paenibacillus cymbidii]